jgi:hypothetical protein
MSTVTQPGVTIPGQGKMMVVMDIIKTLLQSGTEGEIYLTKLRSKSHVSRGNRA